MERQEEKKEEGTVRFDEVKAEGFAEKLVGILNAGSTALMLSIGHRTGLFDAMKALPFSSSDEIAWAARLNERYVREWLNAITVAGIIDYDAEKKAYRLPPEHAAWLTRDASPNNIAVFAQYIAVLGSVEDKIVHCFSKGGGVPYSDFSRFHQVMAEDSSQTVVAALKEHIIPLVPGLHESLEKGIAVLDVGCGSGLALNLMAESYPNSSFTGYDFSDEAVHRGNLEARQRGLSNLSFQVRDVTVMKERACYDFITTFDAIHDQAKPDEVLRNIYRLLKDDGTYLMQDISGSSHVHNNIDHPIAPLLYTLSTMHCMTVSLAQGGAGLGTMWGREQATAMLREAGFSRIDIQQLAHDFQNDYYIIKK